MCLPHAGGSASVFRSWQQHTKWLNIVAVQLPGRESRIAEPAHSTLDDLLAAFLPELTAMSDRGYALYGHSMGALVAFEAARRLRGRGLPAPVGLYVAGCEAPHTLRPDPVYDLPKDDLLRWMQGIDGLPPEALEYPALIDLMLCTLRADLQVYDTYRHCAGDPLDIPIGVFCGDSDPGLAVADATRWRELTTGAFRVDVLSGGHFFVQDHKQRILAAIENDLRREALSA